MTTVEDLTRLVRGLTEGAFVARFPRPALVLLSSLEESENRVDTPSTGAATNEALEQKAQFQPKTHQVKSLAPEGDTHDGEEDPTPRRPVVASPDAETPKCAVVFLEKSDRNPFSHMITFGRAHNNDVVLAHPTVSKVHAYFTTSPTGWVLNDQRSTNGTYVEGKPLPKGGSAPLPSGAVIRFGSLVRARFFSPAHLFRFLERGSVGMVQ